MEEKRTLGVMLDCSRNAVMSLPAVKRYIDLLQSMGYNMLMLYTEDTYEVEGEPLFGYLRGRYSAAELQELVAYAAARGIEMIPCIQTLAHLNQLFRWKEYAPVRDLKDILLAGEEKTYELIEAMFRSLRRCFTTDRVHIGMDEAHDVGLGKYLELHGQENRFEILSRHLTRVAAIAQKYGFRTMMWSDMFFRLVAKDYYINDPALITPEIAALVPENVELVYWDYYSDSEAHYATMIEAHQHFNSPLWFAGSAALGSGFTTRNALTCHCIAPAMDACRKAGVPNVIMTLWGDDGGEASFFAALPSLFFTAEYYHGNCDETAIKQKFFSLFGVAFDDFVKLDWPDNLYQDGGEYPSNVAKILLYNDPFLGIYDSMAVDEDTVAQNYAAYAKTLDALADAPVFGYLFRAAADLCAVLELKYALGRRVRRAYGAGDKDALAALVAEFSETERRLDAFYHSYRTVWMTERRPHGFDVQDIRLGGLKQRLIHCRLRLASYLAGDLDRLEELEEERLDRTMYVCRWGETATVNELSSYFMDVSPD